MGKRKSKFGQGLALFWVYCWLLILHSGGYNINSYEGSSSHTITVRRDKRKKWEGRKGDRVE